MATSTGKASEFAAESAFVFVGKVVKARAATMEGLAADNTAIVEVERVVSSPDMFASLGGHQITVRFKTPPSLRKGSSLTFFANGWIFGSSIAVDVVGTAEAGDSRAAAGAVRGSLVAGEDSVLKARLASAALSVVGTVEKVAQSAKPPTHISEHDPDWHEATIDVDEVIKGKKDTKKATVLFPNSDDVRWYRIGKYRTGQKGIWMLQPGKRQDSTGIPAKVMAAVPSGPDVLTSLHQADYLPLHELERVRALAGK
jgi:hypothetical protein